MKRNTLSSVFVILILTCLVLLLLSPAISAQDFLADIFPGLKQIRVEEGQNFVYSIRAEKEGEVTIGEIDFLFVEIDHGIIEIIIEGEFGGQPVSARAMGWKDTPWELISNIGSELEIQLPGEIREMYASTFSMAMLYTAIYGDQFELGWELKDEDHFESAVMFIPEMASYAGVDGYLIKLGESDEMFLEFSVRTDLLLPLMVNISSPEEAFEEEFYLVDTNYSIELIGFTEDADISRVDVSSTDAPLLILAGVVENFKEQGLAVGERSPKFYDMMGAVAGFGIDIEGDEVELYLFDPETSSPDVLENLELARETGEFDSMGFPMPAYVNNYVLMTGLEFGSIYQHPAKDEIIEIFMSYQ